MYQDGCFGCNQPIIWNGYRNFPKKPSSFHIMDILHVRQEQVPSALGPLQDFCRTKRVQSIVSQNSERSATQKDLKFGISRILSDEIGNNNSTQTETENRNKRSIVHTCDCGSPSCGILMFSHLSPQSFHPSHYPYCHTETESLPGPYSILNEETCSGGPSKRKRSWSRAVFSNLQRKGLEKRFEVQKYVTKPDRRQLAAMLGLTDAQVKVWFQNRRMKWRHMQQLKEKELSEKQTKKVKHTEASNTGDRHTDELSESDTDQAM